MSHDWDEILIESFDVELQSANAKINSLEQNLDEVWFQLNEAQERVSAIESSTSWKVSAPLRWVSSVFGKLIP